MHNTTHRRRRLKRAHMNCWYCGYRTWLVFGRPMTNPWRQKPPWIRLGDCCHDAMLALEYVGSSAIPAVSLYQVSLDDLSQSQLRRRLRSKALPGTKRDPTRADRARRARDQVLTRVLLNIPPRLVSEQ
jgi:hypothetical protein